MAILHSDSFCLGLASSFAAGGATGAAAAKVAGRAEYRKADGTNPGDIRDILATSVGIAALCFSLSPRVTIATCTALSKVELSAGTVFGLEKPFGTDLRSAEALNPTLISLVPEQQIHRIDRFLGKTTILNLLGLRFANRVFEPVWNADNIASVDIVFDKELALEGRAGYYDRAGALVDMIQSHLLLVLAVVAMELTTSVGPESRLRCAQARRWRRFVKRSSLRFGTHRTRRHG